MALLNNTERNTCDITLNLLAQVWHSSGAFVVLMRCARHGRKTRARRAIRPPCRRTGAGRRWRNPAPWGRAAAGRLAGRTRGPRRSGAGHRIRHGRGYGSLPSGIRVLLSSLYPSSRRPPLHLRASFALLCRSFFLLLFILRMSLLLLHAFSVSLVSCTCNAEVNVATVAPHT